MSSGAGWEREDRARDWERIRDMAIEDMLLNCERRERERKG